MLEMLDVPPEMLPTPVPSRGPLAEAAAGIFGDRAIPIGASIGDQQAALFGQGGVARRRREGDLRHRRVPADEYRHRRVRVRKIACCSTAALGPAGEPAYALEGSVFIAGAAVQWLRDELKLIAKSADTRATRAAQQRSHRTVFRAGVRRTRRAVLG